MITLIDRATRFICICGLKSLAQDNIISCLSKCAAAAGSLPSKICTDFDSKLLAGKTEQWLLKRPNPCTISAAPSGRQHQNGLAKRNWQTTVGMARSHITDMQMPRSHWFWAMCHAVQVMNHLPVKVNGELTSPFEFVHGVKPDYQALFRLFSTVHFKHESE